MTRWSGPLGRLRPPGSATARTQWAALRHELTPRSAPFPGKASTQRTGSIMKMES
jgi:hypothetical protein